MIDILGLEAGGSPPASGGGHSMDRQQAQATHLDTPLQLLWQTLSCLHRQRRMNIQREIIVCSREGLNDQYYNSLKTCVVWLVLVLVCVF